MEEDEHDMTAMLEHIYKFQYHRPASQVESSGNPWIAGPHGSKYQFNVGHQSWLTAREHCLAQNADLVSITCKGELDWILSHYQPQFGHLRERQIQIGLLLDSKEHYKQQKGHNISHYTRAWHWLNGWPLDISVLQWTAGEPFDHASGKERCGVLNVNAHKLDDIDCDLAGGPNRLYRYICERSAKQHREHEEVNNPIWRRLEDILNYFGIASKEAPSAEDAAGNKTAIRADSQLTENDYRPQSLDDTSNKSNTSDGLVARSAPIGSAQNATEPLAEAREPPPPPPVQSNDAGIETIPTANISLSEGNGVAVARVRDGEISEDMAVAILMQTGRAREAHPNTGSDDDLDEIIHHKSNYSRSADDTTPPLSTKSIHQPAPFLNTIIRTVNRIVPLSVNGRAPTNEEGASHEAVSKNSPAEQGAKAARDEYGNATQSIKRDQAVSAVIEQQTMDVADSLGKLADTLERSLNDTAPNSHDEGSAAAGAPPSPSHVQSKIENLERIIGAVQKMIHIGSDGESMDDLDLINGVRTYREQEQAPLPEIKINAASNSSSPIADVPTVVVDNLNAVLNMEGDFEEASAISDANRLHPQASANGGDFVLSHHDAQTTVQRCEDDEGGAAAGGITTANADEGARGSSKTTMKIEKFLRTLNEFFSTHHNSSTSAELRALLGKNRRGGSLIRRLEQSVEAERRRKPQNAQPLAALRLVVRPIGHSRGEDHNNNATTTPNSVPPSTIIKLHSPATGQQSPTEQIIDAVLGVARNVSTELLTIIPHHTESSILSSSSNATDATNIAPQLSQRNIEEKASLPSPPPFPHPIIPEAEEPDVPQPSPMGSVFPYPLQLKSLSPSNFTIPEEVSKQNREEKERVDSTYANFNATEGGASAIDALIKRVATKEHTTGGDSINVQDRIAIQPNATYGTVQGSEDMEGLMIENWEETIGQLNHGAA